LSIGPESTRTMANTESCIRHHRSHPQSRRAFRVLQRRRDCVMTWLTPMTHSLGSSLRSLR
jgi:hypothetical protein